jgi:predicted transcriptional regulator
MSKNNKKISKKDEKLKNEFFNTPTLFGEEKTSKDFENFQFQLLFNNIQRIINRKKKCKNELLLNFYCCSIL